jgi:hypothetical protein
LAASQEGLSSMSECSTTYIFVRLLGHSLLYIVQIGQVIESPKGNEIIC